MYSPIPLERIALYFCPFHLINVNQDESLLTPSSIKHIEKSFSLKNGVTPEKNTVVISFCILHLNSC